MRRLILISVALIMFFTAGIQMDFGDDVDLPDWVVEIISEEDKGSPVDMTHDPVFKFAKTHLTPIYEELAPASAH